MNITDLKNSINSLNSEISSFSSSITNLLGLCTLVSINKAPTLIVDFGNVSVGDTLDLPIRFLPGIPVNPISGLQWDISIPTGVSYVSISPGDAANSASKSVQAALNGNVLTVILFGINQNVLGSGILCSIRLKGVQVGVQSLIPTNFVASDPNGSVVGCFSVGGIVHVS